MMLPFFVNMIPSKKYSRSKTEVHKYLCSWSLFKFCSQTLGIIPISD
jgi:hypothetical protein